MNPPYRDITNEGSVGFISLLRRRSGSKYCAQRVCMFICSHILKTAFQTSQNFLHALSVAVDRFSSNDSVTYWSPFGFVDEVVF